MLPAARVSDMATCVGPPDVIVKGSPTVLIGNMMAARYRANKPLAMGPVHRHRRLTVMIGEVRTGQHPQGRRSNRRCPRCAMH